MFNSADLNSIHRYSSRHRERVVASARCGCFYCLQMFAPTEISDWVDGPDESDTTLNGTTALCPRCGIDSVLPDSIPDVPLSSELLSAMRAHWFERTVSIG
jgi:hypothetical protein